MHLLSRHQRRRHSGWNQQHRVFQRKYDAVDSASLPFRAGLTCAWRDGSVRTTDTSAVATLQDFDWPSSSQRRHPMRRCCVTDADAEAAVAGIVIAATSDHREPGCRTIESLGRYRLFVPTACYAKRLKIAPTRRYWYCPRLSATCRARRRAGAEHAGCVHGVRQCGYRIGSILRARAGIKLGN